MTYVVKLSISLSLSLSLSSNSTTRHVPAFFFITTRRTPLLYGFCVSRAQLLHFLSCFYVLPSFCFVRYGTLHHLFYEPQHWLGFVPEKTTYSSDNFQALHELAVKLIHKGLAYCCDMTKLEMEQQRELAMQRVLAKNNATTEVVLDAETDDQQQLLPGRNRNTSVARNVEIFANMKRGLYAEGTWTLRLKMDFESSNPNMYDLVAYRIRYTAHPHAGNGWCIYPNYDFTHGICDSLENIDYSICTLEFETRREPYYWILWALDMYRPNVYEMSRLNLQYTVLSKRRLLKLVESKTVRGWNDPRMPTLSGYRRRGFTPTIINTFCTELGVTRAANVIEMEKLFTTARKYFSDHTPRAMAVYEPIQVSITNFHDAVAAHPEGRTFTVQNSPTDPALGSHPVTLTSTLYIDASDFRLHDETEYYGLAPNKAVGLKYYGGNLICDEVLFQEDDNTNKNKNKTIRELVCRLDNSETRTKPKTWISWVPGGNGGTSSDESGSNSTAIPCEIRIYNHLFTVPEPSDTWEDEINPQSEIVYTQGFVDPSVRNMVCASKVSAIQSNQALQFERMGYFVVDVESTYNATTNTGRLIFNRTVTLREEVFKKKTSQREDDANAARKAKQKADLEAKEARLQIDPKDLFRMGVEYAGKYSKYDATTGVPTHLADGTELTKSAMKKLAKEQKKHEKQLMNANKKN